MIVNGVIPVTIGCSLKMSSKEDTMYLKPTRRILALVFG